ncbi:hypothetical protein XYCOK13_10720 [Xylanibacillus composti]|uniref:Uncharacterized protein n=1 Tax=Xylanibacillus composti TaxID=1572762 RepID=A0A8J4GZT9_9BACL|nr:hypothetical protein XYCOK13_10720 [Xylanibacillus composti]
MSQPATDDKRSKLLKKSIDSLIQTGNHSGLDAHQQRLMNKFLKELHHAQHAKSST